MRIGAVTAVALAGGSASLLGLMATGRLTLDLGWGRTLHQLGPIELEIDAPRKLVYQQLSSPYLGTTPRGLRDSLQVLERSDDMVLARHVSQVALFGRVTYSAATVETVQFEEPHLISFHHLRGPVPHAREEFSLEDRGQSTVLSYRGELGIDFWMLGNLAGKHWVVPEWLDKVESHMSEVKAGAEERAASRRRRTARANSEK